MTYGDWRDRLVECGRHRLDGDDYVRIFEPLALGAEILLSAQNSSFHYVSGRHFSLGPPLDLDALLDFEIAFRFVGQEDLARFDTPILQDALDACSIAYDPADPTIGWVSAAQVGCLIERLGGIVGVLVCDLHHYHEEAER